MQFKGSVPAAGDTGAAIIAQLLTNDQVNQDVEDTSVLNTGIVRGNVVKYSVSLSKWVLCDGTVSPGNTDRIGIVEYADGTSGQVRLSGVYQDSALTTLTDLYCQADGSLGTVETKVPMGTVTSTGKLCMPGGGGAVKPATNEALGGIIVGSGLAITPEGILSTNLTIPGISITAGTIAHGGTIPLPDGYTREQCKYAVWVIKSAGSAITGVNTLVDQSTGIVTAQTWHWDTETGNYLLNCTAGYLCIGVK